MKNKLPIKKVFHDAETCFQAMINHIKQFGGKFECDDYPVGKNPKFGWIHKKTNKWFLISGKDMGVTLCRMGEIKSKLIQQALCTKNGKLALVSAINNAGLR